MPYKNEKRVPSVIPASMEWLEDNGNVRAPQLEHRYASRILSSPPTISSVRSAIYALEKVGKSEHTELGTLLGYVVKWCEDTGQRFIVVHNYEGIRLIGTVVVLVQFGVKDQSGVERMKGVR
jgi:hypothetical protein